MKLIKNIIIMISDAPKLMIVIICLSLLVQEFYPFSHFPMYSSFGSNTRYVYLADINDDPIAIKTYFKYSPPKLKKMFMTRIHQMKSEEDGEMTLSDMQKEAAHSLLRYLVQENDNDKIRSFEILKLYLVEVSLENKKMTREPIFLAEVKL